MQISTILISLLGLIHNSVLAQNCSQSLAQQKIQEYLERSDLSEAITSRHVIGDWINPSHFWRGVVNLSNICGSEEAVLLQKYCWRGSQLDEGYGFQFMKENILWTIGLMRESKLEPFPFASAWNRIGRTLTKSSVKSGKIPLHFCELVTPIPTEGQPFNFDHVEKVLGRLLSQSNLQNNRSTLPKINFGPEIKQRLEKEGNETNAAKRDQDAWRQKIEQEIAAINHRIDFHSTLDATSSPSKKDFDQCSSTCASLARTRSGSFTDASIIRCCYDNYNHELGHCTQHIPVCSGPSHQYMAPEIQERLINEENKTNAAKLKKQEFEEWMKIEDRINFYHGSPRNDSLGDTSLPFKKVSETKKFSSTSNSLSKTRPGTCTEAVFLMAMICVIYLLQFVMMA